VGELRKTRQRTLCLEYRFDPPRAFAPWQEAHCATKVFPPPPIQLLSSSA
jgi:hypothetical protein